MNGIHDLGGKDGFGPINPSKWEPNFHSEWEKAAWALFPYSARAGLYGLDEFRWNIEKMPPLHYLMSYYYEHWVYTTEEIGVQKGYWTPEELDQRTSYYMEFPNAPLPTNDDPALVEFANWAVANGFSTLRTTDARPKFQIGDIVIVDNSAPLNHTRRAGYVRGRNGVITQLHGAHVYPDTTGNGLGETAEHLYTVRFTHAELYGEEAAEPNTCLYTDMWEPYISRVN